MKKPTLSIITVNFNNRNGLERTIQSIKSQTYTDYEHIIIDANSTDGSKEIILEYSQNTAHLTYWVSEPDKGIYDGMNKGIEHAQGEYIYLLNSGDILSNPTVLSSISFDGTKYICGNMRIIHSETQYEEVVPPNEIDGLFLFKSYLPHPASFIHHSLFNKQKYNIDYKIISDWIHMVENIVLKGCSYKHINLLISDFDTTGISSNNRALGLSERSKWIKDNIPTLIYDALMELDKLRSYEIGSIIPTLMQKNRHSQKRVKKLILLFSKFFK